MKIFHYINWFSIETLTEENNSVVTAKREFGYQEKSKRSELFEIFGKSMFSCKERDQLFITWMAWKLLKHLVETLTEDQACGYDEMFVW